MRGTRGCAFFLLDVMYVVIWVFSLAAPPEFGPLGACSAAAAAVVPVLAAALTDSTLGVTPSPAIRAAGSGPGDCALPWVFRQ